VIHTIAKTVETEISNKLNAIVSASRSPIKPPITNDRKYPSGDAEDIKL
jgi:hypothetical protein